MSCMKRNNQELEHTNTVKSVEHQSPKKKSVMDSPDGTKIEKSNNKPDRHKYTIKKHNTQIVTVKKDKEKEKISIKEWIINVVHQDKATNITSLVQHLEVHNEIAEEAIQNKQKGDRMGKITTARDSTMTSATQKMNALQQ